MESMVTQTLSGYLQIKIKEREMREGDEVERDGRDTRKRDDTI